LDADEEKGETVTSPLKTPINEKENSEAEAAAKRNLNFDDPEANSEGTKSSSVADEEAIPPPPPAYVDPRSRTKVRKTGDSINSMASSAASSEEDRRAQ
jgi:hypothetical protein